MDRNTRKKLLDVLRAGLQVLVASGFLAMYLLNAYREGWYPWHKPHIVARGNSAPCSDQMVDVDRPNSQDGPTKQIAGADAHAEIRVAEAVKWDIEHETISLSDSARAHGFGFELGHHPVGSYPDLPLSSHSRPCDKSVDKTIGSDVPVSVEIYDSQLKRHYVTYCVDSFSGEVHYNNDLSRSLTVIGLTRF